MISVVKKNSCLKFDGKKVKLKTFNHYLDLYRITISVVIGDKQVSKYHDFMGHSKPIYGMCSNWTDEHNIVLMLFSDDAINNMNIIAHECLHASNVIFNDIGYTSDSTNDEVDAYLVGYLVDVVLKAKKVNKKE